MQSHDSFYECIDGGRGDLRILRTERTGTVFYRCALSIHSRVFLILTLVRRSPNPIHLIADVSVRPKPQPWRITAESAHSSERLTEVQPGLTRNPLVMPPPTVRMPWRGCRWLGNWSGVFPRLLPERLVPRSLEGIPIGHAQMWEVLSL